MSFKKGFTLIELLIVIVIIGVLATIGIYISIGNVAKARDAARKSDLDALKKALAMYNSDNQHYPNNNDPNNPFDCWEGQSCWSLTTGLSLTGYIRSLPTDPKGGNTGACNSTADTSDVCHVYHYCSPDGGKTYILSVNLETGPTKLSSTTTNCEYMSGSHIYYVYSP